MPLCWQITVKCPLGCPSSGHNSVKCPHRCASSGQVMVKCPHKCSTSWQNIVKHYLECPSSGQVECPLGCPSSGQIMAKCLLMCSSSGQIVVTCPLGCPSSGFTMNAWGLLARWCPTTYNGCPFYCFRPCPSYILSPPLLDSSFLNFNLKFSFLTITMRCHLKPGKSW